MGKNQQKIETGGVLNGLSVERSEKMKAKVVKNDEKPYDTLLQKHAIELDNLMKIIDSEEKLGVQKAKQDIRRKREKLRDQFERRKLEEKENIDNEEDLTNFENELKTELLQFDSKTSELIKKAKIDPRMKLDHAGKNLALREKQLKELADCVKKSNINSEKNTLLQQAAEEARLESENARNLRLSIIAKADAKIVAEKKLKLEKLRKAQEMRGLEIKKKQDEIDKKFEKDSEIETKKLNDRIEKKIKHSRSKTDNEIRQVLERSDIDEAEKERLIKELQNAEKLREL